MGICDQKKWDDVAQVLLKKKKIYSLQELSISSGVYSYDLRRILDFLSSRKLVIITRLSNQLCIDSEVTSAGQVSDAYGAYMKKYHGR